MLRYLTYPFIFCSAAALVIQLPMEFKYLGLVLCLLLCAFLPTPISLEQAKLIRSKREKLVAQRVETIKSSADKVDVMITKLEHLFDKKIKPAEKYIGVSFYKFARTIPSNIFTDIIFVIATSIAFFTGFWTLIDSALVDMIPLGGHEHNYKVSSDTTLWLFAVSYFVASSLRNENVALSFMLGFCLSLFILACSKDVGIGIIEAHTFGLLAIPLLFVLSKVHARVCPQEKKINFNPKPHVGFILLSYIVNCIITTLIAASADLTDYESPYMRALSLVEAKEVNVHKPEYILQMKTMALAQSDYTPSYPQENVPLNSILPAYAALVENPKAMFISTVALPLFIYELNEDFAAHLNVVAHGLEQLNWKGIHAAHKESIDKKGVTYYETLDLILFEELVQAALKGSQITVQGVVKAHYDTITDTSNNVFPMKGKTELNSNLKLTSNMLTTLAKFDDQWGVGALLPKRAKGSIAVAQTRPDFQDLIDFVVEDTKYLHDNIMNITLKSEINRKAIGGTSNCNLNGWACLPDALYELYWKRLRELISL